MAPKACFLIISNPVNSTVPIFAEVLKKAGKDEATAAVDSPPGDPGLAR